MKSGLILFLLVLAVRLNAQEFPNGELLARLQSFSDVDNNFPSPIDFEDIEIEFQEYGEGLCSKKEINFYFEDPDIFVYDYDRFNVAKNNLFFVFGAIGADPSTYWYVRAFFGQNYTFNSESCTYATYNQVSFPQSAHEEPGAMQRLNDPMWSVRFLNQISGNFQGRLVMFLTESSGANRFYMSNSITWSVEGTGNCDYIRLKNPESKPTLLSKSNEVIIPIGENLPDDRSVSVYYANGAWSFPNQRTGACYYQKVIDELRAHEGNYMRIDLATRTDIHNKYSIGDEVGNASNVLIYKDRSDIDIIDVKIDFKNCARWDYIFEYGRTHGVFFMPSMMSFALFNQNVRNHNLNLWERDFNPFIAMIDNYNSASYNFAQKSGEPFDLSNTDLTGLYESWIAYAVARWGYLDNLTAWEIFDEPWSLATEENDQHMDNIGAWLSHMLNRLEFEDIDRHLVYTGLGKAAYIFEANSNSGARRIQNYLNSTSLSKFDIVGHNDGVFDGGCDDWGSTFKPLNCSAYYQSLVPSYVFQQRDWLSRTNIISSQILKFHNYHHDSQYKNTFLNSFWFSNTGGVQSTTLIDPNGIMFNSYLYGSFLSGSFMPGSYFFGSIDLHKNIVHNAGPLDSCKRYDFGSLGFEVSNYWLSHLTHFSNFVNRSKYLDNRYCIDNMVSNDRSRPENSDRRPLNTDVTRNVFHSSRDLVVFNPLGVANDNSIDAYLCYEKYTADKIYAIGYVQDRRFQLENLYSPHTFGCEYVQNFDASVKPPPRPLWYTMRFDVPKKDMCMRIRYYNKTINGANTFNISSRTVDVSLNEEMLTYSWLDGGSSFAGRNVANIGIPYLNGPFGDLTFEVESINREIAGISDFNLNTRVINSFCKFDDNIPLEFSDYCDDEYEGGIAFHISVVDPTTGFSMANYGVKSFTIGYSSIQSIKNFDLKRLINLTQNTASWPTNWVNNITMYNFNCSSPCLGIGSVPSQYVFNISVNQIGSVSEPFNFWVKMSSDCDAVSRNNSGSNALNNSDSQPLYESILIKSENSSVLYKLLEDNSMIGQVYELYNGMGQLVKTGVIDSDMASLFSGKDSGVFVLLVKNMTIKISWIK